MTGRLKKIVDNEHSIFSDNKLGNIYIGTSHEFSQELINKEFKYELFERYSSDTVIFNNKGKWKLIDLYIQERNGKNISYLFKSNNNNKIIDVTISQNSYLNDRKYGDNFDLELMKSYKIMEWLGSKDNEFQEVTMLLYYDNSMKIKMKNGEIATMTNRGNDIIPQSYLGKKIYVKLLPKYMADNILIYNPPINFNEKTLKIAEELSIINFTYDITKRKFTDKENIYCVLTDSIVNDINISEKVGLKYLHLNYIKEIEKNNDGEYLLEGITHLDKLKIYIFKKDNKLFSAIIENSPHFQTLIGKNFDFKLCTLKLISNITASDTGKYVFLSIINNKYLFGNLENGKKIHYLLEDSRTPTDSNIGRRFHFSEMSILYSPNFV